MRVWSIHEKASSDNGWILWTQESERNLRFQILERILRNWHFSFFSWDSIIFHFSVQMLGVAGEPASGRILPFQLGFKKWPIWKILSIKKIEKPKMQQLTSRISSFVSANGTLALDESITQTIKFYARVNFLILRLYYHMISLHFQMTFISERQTTWAFLFPNSWTERFSDSCRDQTPGRRCGHFWYGLPSYSWISLCYNGTRENSRSEAYLDSNLYGFCEIRLSRWKKEGLKNISLGSAEVGGIFLIELATWNF